MIIVAYIFGGLIGLTFAIMYVKACIYYDKRATQNVLCALAQGPLTENELVQKLSIHLHSNDVISAFERHLKGMVKQDLIVYSLDKNGDLRYSLTSQGTDYLRRTLSP